MKNKNKQIEEMAKALGEGRSQDCSHYVCCSACPCDFCCIFQENAHILVQEGYRKASDVAREIIELLKSAGIDRNRYPIIAEIEKKYEESQANAKK